MEASLCASIALKIGKSEPDARNLWLPQVGGFACTKKHWIEQLIAYFLTPQKVLKIILPPSELEDEPIFEPLKSP